MDKTKEQQAQQYAKNKSIALRKAWYLYRYGGMYDSDDWTRDTVKPSDNFEYGFNAGYTACEQSMWRSVEEELPSNDDDVLISDGNGLHIACYFNCEWYSVDDEFTGQPQMWMPIPSVPDTNNEKK